MKKRRFISLVMAMFIIILAVTLTACGDAPHELRSPESISSSISNLEVIDGEDILFYDKNTKVVYYLFSTDLARTSTNARGFGFMSPYISENGNYCRYIDGKIVEIQK